MRPGSRQMTDWLRPLLQRKPRKLTAVALANKMARMAWAMMTSGEAYRRPAGAGTPPGVVWLIRLESRQQTLS